MVLIIIMRSLIPGNIMYWTEEELWFVCVCYHASLGRGKDLVSTACACVKYSIYKLTMSQTEQNFYG